MYYAASAVCPQTYLAAASRGAVSRISRNAREYPRQRYREDIARLARVLKAIEYLRGVSAGIIVLAACAQLCPSPLNQFMVWRACLPVPSST